MFFASILPKVKQLKNKKYIVATISALPLYLITIFRYNVGTDYFSTIEGFIHLRNYNLVDNEPIFLILSKIIHYFSLNGQWVHIILDTILFFFLFKKIFESSPNPALSIFLFIGLRYYFESLNIERQFVGCAICLYSTKYIYENNFKKFIFSVLFASCFHYSCLIYLIMYFIRNTKLNFRSTIIFMLILLIFSTNVENIIRTIIEFTPYSRYIGGRFDRESNKTLSIILFILFYIFAYIFRNDSIEYNTYLNSQCLCIIFMQLIGAFSLIIRYKYLFGFPLIILIPKAINNIKDRNLRIIVSVVIVAICSIYIYISTIKNDYYNIIPYMTIFSRL